MNAADIVCITEYNILHFWEISSDIFVALKLTDVSILRKT